MNRSKNLWRKSILVPMVLLLTIGLFFNGMEAKALEEGSQDADVLVIYSTKDGEISPEQRLLDMALGHFAEEVVFRNVKEVTSEDVKEKTHLFYYGQKEEKISKEAADIISSFNGPTVAIGYNVERIGEKFSFVHPIGEQEIVKLEIPEDKTKTRNIEPNTIFGTKLEKGTEVLVKGTGAEGTYPLVSKDKDSYYIATDRLVPPYSVYFSQALNTVFNKKTSEATPAYLRLEDVHPLADAEGLMEIADFLKEKNIPYMIAVIPVYKHPETGEEHHFNDSPKVLEALKYMQDNGGSVVLHGYTHQFRDTETGEGFEFWDVKHDMPIYHGPKEKAEDKTEKDFNSKEEYEAYVKENKAFETAYIEERLIRGVQELSNFGLYPLAFEAPHYTMSQNGYQVVSEHFSTYVGQVQLSDKDWKTMETTPYISKPGFLNGMTLLPETIGYINPDDEKPLEKMMAKAEEYQINEGGLIGGFYHPYLGIDGLKEVVRGMESIPNIEWIDLKQMENTVKVENVSISSGEGEIKATIDNMGLMATSVDFPAYHVKVFVEKVTWGIAGVGVTAVIMFTGYTLLPASRKKLTGRRKSNG